LRTLTAEFLIAVLPRKRVVGLGWERRPAKRNKQRFPSNTEFLGAPGRKYSRTFDVHWEFAELWLRILRMAPTKQQNLYNTEILEASNRKYVSKFVFRFRLLMTEFPPF
jgi:hypothetical protein